MATISTHVLDTSLGRPAQGVAIELDRLDGDAAERFGGGVTNADGRVTDLLSDAAAGLTVGRYRMRFVLSEYWAQGGRSGFYPEAAVVFDVADASEHYHVPLLLSPYGYSTYRGS
ncbi:MAG: hydroxyisourate hydrolase [Planctomycetota bacterium]